MTSFLTSGSEDGLKKPVIEGSWSSRDSELNERSSPSTSCELFKSYIFFLSRNLLPIKCAGFKELWIVNLLTNKHFSPVIFNVSINN
jgi:hypothetical protein